MDKIKIPYGPEYCTGCLDKQMCTSHAHLFGRRPTEDEKASIRQRIASIRDEWKTNPPKSYFYCIECRGFHSFEHIGKNCADRL